MHNQEPFLLRWRLRSHPTGPTANTVPSPGLPPALGGCRRLVAGSAPMVAPVMPGRRSWAEAPSRPSDTDTEVATCALPCRSPDSVFALSLETSLAQKV